MEKVIFELPQFEAARLRALDFTRRTGREYGFIMDPKDGRILGEVEGTSDKVDFAAAGLSATIVEGRWVTHTHPDDSSFSMQDLFMASAFGAEGATVLGPKGSVYTVTDLKTTGHAYMDRRFFNFTADYGKELAYRMFKSREFTDDEIQLSVSHHLNLRARGVTGHKYEYELARKVQAAYEKFLRLKVEYEAA